MTSHTEVQGNPAEHGARFTLERPAPQWVDAGLRRLLEPLTFPEASPAETTAEVETLYARLVWSRLSEPGDGTAGALITALGPRRALAAVIQSWEPAELCAAIELATQESIAPDQLRRAIERWRPRLDQAAVAEMLHQAHRSGLHVVTPDRSGWPPRCDDLGAHAPILLWVSGDLTLLSAPSIAVVGARACTGYGMQVTAELVEGLCDAHLTIVSGAAHGVDGVAHRTALACSGGTVAVLAGGADTVYPAAHAELLARITASGVVCSEVPPGTAPTRWRFLQRNRLIAALSAATVITEAGMRSGSINTAGQPAGV